MITVRIVMARVKVTVSSIYPIVLSYTDHGCDQIETGTTTYKGLFFLAVGSNAGGAQS